MPFSVYVSCLRETETLPEHPGWEGDKVGEEEGTEVGVEVGLSVRGLVWLVDGKVGGSTEMPA